MEKTEFLNKKTQIYFNDLGYFGERYKNRKILAWCSLCCKIFMAGPKSNICKNHLKVQCNIVECQKKGFPNCVRKFINVHAEFSHKLCITLTKFESLDKNIDIQMYRDNSHNLIKGIGNCYMNDNLSNFQQIKFDSLHLSPYERDEIQKNYWTKQNQEKENINDKVNHQNREYKHNQNNINLQITSRRDPRKNNSLFSFEDKSKNNLSSNYDYFNQLRSSQFKLENSYVNKQYFKSQETVSDKIADNSQSKLILEGEIDSIIDDNFNQIDFNPVSCFPHKEFNELNSKDLANNFDYKPIASISFLTKKNTIQADPKEKIVKFNKKSEKCSSSVLGEDNINYFIHDDTTINELFQQVYNMTKISKQLVLNKLKKAFNKRGYTNAKIIRLRRNKQNNWNFLYEDFRDVCTESEGVALVLESLLEKIL